MINNVVEKVLSQLENVERNSNGWTAKCPAHDDQKNSLSISNIDGKILFKCHAGCTYSDITKALGWEATYDYTDELGKLLHQVVRVDEPDGKKITQRKPIENGGWEYNLKSVKRVLYNLPDVIEAETVFIVEGEKCADCLIEIGLVATTNSGGAGKWDNAYKDCLEGKTIYLLPDNDRPGQRHMEKVAKALYGVASSVQIIELPGLPEKGDVADWLEIGGTAEELSHIAKTAIYWEPSDLDDEEVHSSTESRPGKRPCTDLGNAERFSDQHSGSIRYIVELSQWIKWDNNRWAFVSENVAFQAAKDTVRNIYKEAEAEKNDERRRQLGGWAIRSESRATLANMLNLAEKEKAIIISADQLDQNHYLLNTLNGTVNLKTGELYAARKEDYITKQVSINFDQVASCPRWVSFLEEVLPKQEMRDFIQRAVGYSLTGSVSEQGMFFLFGDGKNGKSKFISILEIMLKEYWHKTRAEVLMVGRYGVNTGATPELVKLKGQRLVTASEVQNGQKLNEALVKDLTGGDMVSARPLFKDPINFQPTHKIWMYGNYKPKIEGVDEGIWRRLVLIPFTVQIPLEKRDKDLEDKLRVELSGILAWAIRGCLEWQANGLQVPASILEATKEYREEQDNFSHFLEQYIRPDKQYEELGSVLYKLYKGSCEEAGEPALKVSAFNKELEKRGFKKDHRGGVVHFYGLKIATGSQ